MSAIAGAIRAVAGMVGAAKGRKGQAAVRSASNNVQAARAVGNKGDIARAYNNLDRAQAAADRNDYVQGRTSSVIDLMDTVTAGLLPNTKYCHTITVSVKGGPEASLRRCWFLCISALFGRRRRGIEAFWAEALNAQWDITGKTVTATISYATSSLTDPWINVIDTQNPYAMLQRGPDQVTIGAGWESYYLMFNQQAQGTGLPKIGLQWARMIGGKLGIAGPLVPDAGPLPGQFEDPLVPNKFNKDPRVLGQLPPFLDPKVDADLMTIGWRVMKGDNDALQPMFAAVFQPWTVRTVTHCLAELPINNVDIRLLPQLLPYRSHSPAPLDGIRYVTRGGLLGVIPRLPDEGRVITTGEKLDPRVQPVKPPVDGLSRGHLLMMVSAALGDPGVLVEAPKNLVNNTQPIGSEGLYVALPGSQYMSTEDRYRVQPKILYDLVRNVFQAIGERPTQGLTVPLRVDNLRPPSPRDAELGGLGQGGLGNPELRN